MKKYNYTYKVTLAENGQFYIGVRSCDCLPEEDTNYKGSMYAWKVDKTSLIKEIICTYDSRESANIAERFMLILQKKYNKNPLCMNAHIPGVGWCVEGTSHPFTEEHKRKISEAKKGSTHATISIESKKKISNALLGICRSTVTRQKISEAAKNRAPITEETRQKMKRNHKGGLKKGFVSDNAKKNMSESAKNRAPMTEVTKQKLREATKKWRNNGIK